jgi:hypothetical protein
MTLEELKNQVLVLDGGIWSPEEDAEINSVLSAIESGSESSLREVISELEHCGMLKTLCERF